MDYRERQYRRQEQFDEAHGIDPNLGRMLDQFVPPESPRDGDTWGRWVFVAESSVLRIESYEIPLDEMSSSAAMLDWIFQMEAKPWVKNEDLGNLLHALDDLIGPQGALCSGGIDRRFDAKKHFAELR